MNESFRNMKQGFETINNAPNNKFIGKITTLIIVLLVIGFLALNSIYTITEQEQAVLITCGKASAVTTPGLHFKIPFIQEVKKVNTTIQGLSIGYQLETGQSIEDESLMITSDYNFVNVDFFLEYRVSDPVKAIYASNEPISILKNIGQSSIRTVISASTVDDVITTGKNEIQASIKSLIMEKLETEALGIQLVNITIQDAEPPTTAVIEAFKAVETAKQGKETALNNANKYRNEEIPAAEASADAIVKAAEAEKTQRINEATAQVARFNSMYAEYIKNPTITKQRMFYEAMEDILPDLKVLIDTGDGTIDKIYPMESFVTSTSNTNTTIAQP